MKKNKLKLLLSIIICFSLINIGGVFSYAGISSGGGGSGGSVGGVAPIAVFKKWQPDKTGNYGPDKDKPVIINAELSFQVKHEGQVLNFEISRHSATQRIKNYPRMAGQSDQIAFIDFVTGQKIVEENNVISQWYVTTIKDKDGKGYVTQFVTSDLYIKPNTHEAIIREILVYKEPKNPIAPPVEPPQVGIYKKTEQPDPNATVYSDVKAKLRISEMQKYKDYDENIEIDMIRVGPPVAPEGSVIEPRNSYLPYPALEITVTNTYNPPVPEEEKPPVPPEENTPPKEKTKKPSVPNTGDSEAFMILISLLAIGTAGAVITVKRKNS